MTNRELETRYMHMKQTWKTLVDANVSLVDENKDLKEEIERLNNIIKEVREILLCYGETFDLKVHQQMQKELLEILDKVEE